MNEYICTSCTVMYAQNHSEELVKNVYIYDFIEKLLWLEYASVSANIYIFCDFLNFLNEYLMDRPKLLLPFKFLRRGNV